MLSAGGGGVLASESRGGVMGAVSGASLVLEPPQMLSLANFLFKAGLISEVCN